MIGEYVGWVRHGWTRWEPIITGDDPDRLWGRLRVIELHDIDGERVVLPCDEKPVVDCGSPD
jgi:hypothetical protein